MVTNRIIYNSYSPWVFDMWKAEGSHIWKKDGAKLIDFSSGWNVANLGWNHPEIAEAVVKQAEKNVYAPMWTADDIQTTYAAQLTEALPKGLEAVGRATGGTEANEMALKMARAKTGRSKIIGIKDSYHGQSFGDLSLGHRPEYVKAIAPLVPDFIQVDFPSPDRMNVPANQTLPAFLQTLEDILKNNDVAAILTEPGIITGWGSVSVAPEGYLKAVRELTQKYGTLLIVDEVGTGFSRCGALFGLENADVTPDIVTFAKGISNGAGVLAAAVTTNEIAEAVYASAHLTSTFGWTPLACAAAQKTLEIHKRDKVWEKARSDGGYMVSKLRQELAGVSNVKDVRGLGMEIGIELQGSSGKDVAQAALAKGLHLAETDEAIVQIMPPLTTSRSVLDEGIGILTSTIKSLAA
jgi:acetylornithine/succinyldiaminopimelate/putrescine aminotransferase